MATLSAFLIALLAPVQPAYACTANNHVRPVDIAADGVTKLLQEKNYKQLDALYKRYVTEKTATADGISALSGFYKGISASFNYCATRPATDQEWRAHHAALDDWIKASPEPAGARLALALSTIDYGWHARGDGVASTVSAQSRQLFDKRMASAKRQLDKLAPAAADNAAWHYGMLYLGLAQGWPAQQVEAIYERAVHIDPYYIELHYEMAEYSSDHWYGSDEKMVNVMNRSADLTRQRLGQTMYTRMHWTRSESPSMFDSGAVNWERMKTGFEDYLKIYSDPSTRSHYAMFACRARDAATLKQQLDLLGSHFYQDAWRSQRQRAYCTALAALSGTGKEPACSTDPRTDEVVCK